MTRPVQQVAGMPPLASKSARLMDLPPAGLVGCALAEAGNRLAEMSQSGRLTGKLHIGGINGQLIHPNFLAWLSAPRANPSDILAVLEDIRANLIPNFEYSRATWLAEDVKILHNVTEGTLHVSSTLQPYNLLAKSGDCVELSIKAKVLIRLKYPELDKFLQIRRGYEGKYFNNILGGAHAFLLLASSHPRQNYVIDASMHVVEEISEAGYLTFSVSNSLPDFSIAFSQVVRNRSIIVFGTSENGYLISIGLDVDGIKYIARKSGWVVTEEKHEFADVKEIGKIVGNSSKIYKQLVDFAKKIETT